MRSSRGTVTGAVSIGCVSGKGISQRRNAILLLTLKRTVFRSISWFYGALQPLKRTSTGYYSLRTAWISFVRDVWGHNELRWTWLAPKGSLTTVGTDLFGVAFPFLPRQTMEVCTFFEEKTDKIGNVLGAVRSSWRSANANQLLTALYPECRHRYRTPTATADPFGQISLWIRLANNRVYHLIIVPKRGWMQIGQCYDNTSLLRQSVSKKLIYSCEPRYLGEFEPRYDLHPKKVAVGME